MINSIHRKNTKLRHPIWVRLLIFLTFLFSVNLLAGYIAIKLNYPSLYHVKARFAEYAIPLPFAWGLAHVPSMLIFGIPLLSLSAWQEKYKRNFRIICVCSFLLLLLELDRKIPFLLFPKVDALVAFFFSLVVSPPNRKDNALLVAALKLSIILGGLGLAFFSYWTWKHQTPVIVTTEYVDGLFELKSIAVRNDFHKSMVFEVDLKRDVLENQACDLAQTLAVDILRDYPFDNAYNKIITVTFNPISKKPNFKSYELGEISLNSDHKETDGRFACYLRYKGKSDL